MVLPSERRLSDQQLMDENAQRPIVRRSIMSLIQNDLRRDILGGAGKRPCLLTQTHPFGETKVNL